MVSNGSNTLDNCNSYATHLSIYTSLTFGIVFVEPSLVGSVFSKKVSDTNDNSSHIDPISLVMGSISND